MVIRKAFRYRLYPNKEQSKHLEWMLERCRELYNAALEERREAYRMCGQTINFYAQDAQVVLVKADRPDYRAMNSNVLTNVLHRVDRAFAEFFRRCKAGQTPGYPRFKGHDRYDSLTFPRYGNGCKVRGERLYIQGVGLLKVRWSRAIQGVIKTVTIHRDADQWYVLFSTVLEIEQPTQPDRPAVGLDMGLEHFATLSDGTHIPNPRLFRRSESLMTRRQQALRRKKKGSRRRRKAKLLVAKAYRKTRNQRRDFHHKEARTLVDACGAIAVEKLRITMLRRRARPKLDEAQTAAVGTPVYAANGGSAKSGLNRSIDDVGWATFIAILTHKAEEAGVVVVAVDPSGTSQACSGCGRDVPKALSERWHLCPYEDCGLSLQRDHNGARNVLNRAGLARQAST